MNISPQDFRIKLYTGEHLPKGLIVKGNVDVSSDTYPNNLPEDLTIEGYLDLERCTKLTHLPRGLVVHRYLDLSECYKLKHLPDDLRVGTWLGLIGCNSLTNLPHSIQVDRYIMCTKNLIDEIPLEDLPLYLNFKFHGKDTYEYLTKRIQKENTK